MSTIFNGVDDETIADTARQNLFKLARYKGDWPPDEKHRLVFEQLQWLVEELAERLERGKCEHRWVATRGAWERCELCRAERAAGA